MGFINFVDERSVFGAKKQNLYLKVSASSLECFQAEDVRSF
jgi:hypothetical protein